MANGEKGIITARLYRCNPAVSDESRYDTYKVESDHAMTVLAILRHIFRFLDASVAFRDFECYRGVCLSCEMSIKGRKVKACSIMVRPGEEITLDPLQGYPLIKDLVVAFE